MNVIDQNGRIIRTINLVDLIILTFIILLIVTSYRYLLLNDFSKIYEPCIVSRNILIKLDNLTKEYENEIKIGLNYTYQDNSSFEIKLINKDLTRKREVNLFLLSEVKILKTYEYLYFNKRVIQLGNNISLKTDHLSIDGIVLNIKKGSENEVNSCDKK